MAKFEDYQKQHDELDQEIVDSAEAAVARSDGYTMPDQFVGKSPEEIAASYVELQAMQARQANELGEARRALAENASRYLDNAQNEEPAPEAAPLTVDDLYEDPEAAISRVVNKNTNSRVEALEAQLAQAENERQFQALRERFPTAETDAVGPEFAEWLEKSPLRQRLAAQANSLDFDAANDLFELYYDHRTVGESAAEEAARQAALDAATLESGSTQMEAPEETLSRSEYQFKKQMAARGDREAEVWLKQNRDAIHAAYGSGRLTN